MPINQLREKLWSLEEWTGWNHAVFHDHICRLFPDYHWSPTDQIEVLIGNNQQIRSLGLYSFPERTPSIMLPMVDKARREDDTLFVLRRPTA
jgi:hypothetical protein